MTGRVFAWLLSLGVTVIANAQNPDQVFHEANQLYQQGKPAEARRFYESILQNGYESGSLYYNLGNACYKTGDIARAILNYERARKFMPDDDDVLHNLQLANLMIVDKIEPTPRLFVWEYWDDVKGAFSLSGITWMTYALFVLSIALVIVGILGRSDRSRRLGFLGGAAVGFVFLLAFVVLAAKVYELEQRDSAIVTAEITTIKNSPDAKSTDAFVLHGGVKVLTIDRLNEWVKIRLADGKVGWMEAAAAEVI
jgi:tetratricopeptide (TPR) repeat protein